MHFDIPSLLCSVHSPNHLVNLLDSFTHYKNTLPNTNILFINYLQDRCLISKDTFYYNLNYYLLLSTPILAVQERDMKRFTSLLALLLCIATLSVQGQLTDCWAPANWTSSTAGTTGSVTIDPFFIELVNDMDFAGTGLDSIDCGNTTGTVSACIIAPEGGDLIFTWNIMGGFFYSPLIDRFGYCVNGEATTLSSIDPPPFGTTSGVDTISFNAGDEICFVYASKFADVAVALPVTISGFVTPSCPTATCDGSVDPTGMSSTVTGTSVSLSWDAITDAFSYQVYGRLAGSTTVQNASTSTNSFSVSGLSALSTYEWVVRARCNSGNFSAFSPIQTFTTGVLREGSFEKNIYPNPSSDVVYIDGLRDDAVVRILNVNGSVIHEERADNRSIINISTSEIPTGLYLVEVLEENDYRHYQLLVQHD